ncbi:hypothetical protein N7481_003271 [Penicillium waksmanii]|uniref:uncharacterized protein n=1 Tax=Penicillium waksmanii TaxID=69791 RepID=UPI00254688F1|nr:uncharacterized protein N7481_003271 [Penicillium waksmanii]KAJ5988061.1 hypothetical protein N7481_003271 [Penicillium waksmanii]
MPNTQVYCTPNTEFLVLDTRTPSTSFVKDFSLSRKGEENETGPRPGPEPDVLIRDVNDLDAGLDEAPAVHVSSLGVRPVTPSPESITESSEPLEQDSPDMALLGTLLNPRAESPSPSLPDAESPSAASNSESIIVQNELHRDGFLGDDILPDPFLGELELDSSPFQDRIQELDLDLNEQDSDQFSSTLGSPDRKSGGSPQVLGTFLPRKRSAKAASLPDSVTDSERGYNRGKKLVAAPSLPSTPSPIKHSHSTSSNSNSNSNSDSNQRSLIPRPRSHLGHGQSRSESSKGSLPLSQSPSQSPSLSRGKSAPIIEADFRRFENDISPLFKESRTNKKREDKDVSLDRRVLKHNDGSSIIRLSTRSPVTPSKSSHQARDAVSRSQSDLEKLSTVATIGSPCDFTGLPGDSDDLDNADNASFSVSPGQSGAAVLVQPLPIWITDNNSTGESEKEPEPRLAFTAGRFHIVTPSGMEPAVYQVKITLSVPLQDGRPGWRELLVPGLPRLPPDEHGYVYFVVPQNIGLEFRTSHLKRYKIVEGCLMGQMLISSRLILPLRPCHSNFFGYLKDFNVGQEIDEDILSDNESFRLVRYHATCSINLIQTDFWAERCGLWLYIHGGPQGEFCCSLLKPGYQDIHLQHLGNGNTIGVSRVEILASRSNLDKFAITWEVKIAKGLRIRIPRIRSNEYSEAGVEDELREDVAQMQDRESVKAEAIYKGSGVKFLLTSPKEEPTSIPSTTLQSSKPRNRWLKWLKYIDYAFDPFRIWYSIMIFREYWARYQMGAPFPFLRRQFPEVWCAGGDPEHHWHLYTPVHPEVKRIADAVAKAGVKDGEYQISCAIEGDPPVLHDCSIVILPGVDDQREGDDHILVHMEESVSETMNENENEAENVSGIEPVSMRLRDRIDYFLGWKGPLVPRAL